MMQKLYNISIKSDSVQRSVLILRQNEPKNTENFDFQRHIRPVFMGKRTNYIYLNLNK